MKIQVLQENLQKSVNIASRFVSTRAQLPVLGTILLSTSKNNLNLQATNLEISVSMKIGAKVEEEGKIAIPARTIADLVSNLPNQALTLSSEKEALQIGAENFTGTILGMNASDFPSIPDSVEGEQVNLPTQKFLKALSQVIFASSQDESRPVLTGVLFLFSKDSLVLVGTDGFRLSQKKLSIEIQSEVSKVIVPRTVLVEFPKILNSEESVSLKINTDDNQIIASNPNAVISSRVIEGEFPNFEKIIPKSAKTKIFVDKEDLSRGVKLASVFARDSGNIVVLKASEGLIELSAESSKSGKQKVKMEAKVEGENIEILFNYRFIEEFLNSISGEEVLIELSEVTSPGVFKDTKDLDFLHLIMPVKL